MGKQWIKILLVVGVAFVLSVANFGVWPGHLITAFISSHVNIYLWVWADALKDPQVVWRWLEIAFNTIFYSGLFWLVLVFVRRKPESWRFGLAIYIISFLLPAVWNDGGYHPGWSCALLALFVWRDDFPGATARYSLGVKLTIFGGVINLLVIAYFLLRIFGQTPRTQKAAAWAILGCLPPMWVSLYLMGAIPSIGHAAWIVGILLMVFEDIREFDINEVLQRVAFLICGLMTFPLANVYWSFQQAAVTGTSSWSLFVFVLLVTGVLALYVALAPSGWLPRAAKTRSLGSKFLLGSALVGLLIVMLVFRLVSSAAFQSLELVYSLCPACVLTTKSLYAVAPINGLVFGAVGGVIGTALGIAPRTAVVKSL